MSDWHIAVVIPARNEEALLPRCLESVSLARQYLPQGVTSDVVVGCDSSTDGTLSIATQMLEGRGLALNLGFSCVGMARSTAVNAAIARCVTPLDQCWIANTDADCIVPPNWLSVQLALAKRGAAAVAGIVDVDSFAEHKSHVGTLFRRTYHIHASGIHSHVHGANLGVRADAYVNVGGWSNLETAEDHDLWKRLDRFGYEMRSDARLAVITSGRRLGRAPLGFAAALAAHNEAVA